MPAHKLKPALLSNTSPPVWLSVETRLAIRAFARAHDHHQVEELETIVASSAAEFHALHQSDPWFTSHPKYRSHTFTGLEVASEDPAKPTDLLVLVLSLEPPDGAGMLCIYTPAEKPLGEDYHVARVIHESCAYAL